MALWTNPTGDRIPLRFFVGHGEPDDVYVVEAFSTAEIPDQYSAAIRGLGAPNGSRVGGLAPQLLQVGVDV